MEVLGYVDPMWWREYKDYKPDDPLIKERVESGKGLIGCEMHDLNGWGLSHHRYRRRPGVITQFLAALFGIHLEK